LRRVAIEDVERIARAGEEILDALQDQRRTVARVAGADFIEAHPDVPQDALIERAAGVMIGDASGKSEAHIGRPGRLGVVIDAEQRFGHKMVCAFFKGFAHDRFGQCFIGFEVTGGLVEQRAVFGFLFNQKKPAVAFDHRGDGDLGLPDGFGGGHGPHCTVCARAPKILRGGPGMDGCVRWAV